MWLPKRGATDFRPIASPLLATTGMISMALPSVNSEHRLLVLAPIISLNPLLSKNYASSKTRIQIGNYGLGLGCWLRYWPNEYSWCVRGTARVQGCCWSYRFDSRVANWQWTLIWINAIKEAGYVVSDLRLWYIPEGPTRAWAYPGSRKRFVRLTLAFRYF